MKQTDPVKIEHRPRISKIWIVPIVASLIGLWMIYDYIDNKGVSITIIMPNAEGVSAGKTPIKTRSVPIGLVSEVSLSENQEQVLVTVEIEKAYLSLLKSDSLIWSVQPRINESGISGLGTILSGIHFELQPGSSEKTARVFNLIPSPPLVSQNIKGRRFKLFSHSAEVLQVGSPVLFKGVKVGSIETADFDWYSETMYYQVFIESPNYNLVTENTLFWVESGIELDLSADGINFKSGSLSKLLGGSITFGRPPREPKGEVAKADQQFALSSSFKESLEQRYLDFEYYVVLLDDSVRGLKPDAPIEYRGIRIGSVEEVPVMLERDGKPYFMTDTSKAIAVLIKIEFARIYRDSKIARQFWEGNIDKWIDDGLRLSLKTGNLLTGSMFLEVNFFPEQKNNLPKTIADYKIIPGASSGLSQLSEQMAGFLKKINLLEIEKTLSRIDTTLSSFTQLADKTEAVIEQANTSKISQEINQSLKELQATLKGFQHDGQLYSNALQSLKVIEKLAKDFQNGAPAYDDIRRSLKSIEQLTNELQPFTKSLNEHPNILIFDKSPKQDVQPQRGSNHE